MTQQQKQRQQQQHKLEDFLDTLQFDDKDAWRIGVLGGFIEQYIGLYHLTDKEIAAYGLPPNENRLADNNILALMLDGHHRAVFRYIFDRLHKRPQQSYQVRQGVPVRKEEMRRALLDILKILQFPRRTYETYDFPRLFTDTPFRKTWRSYVDSFLIGAGKDRRIMESFIQRTGDDDIRRFLAVS
ncbi:hypothetical protein EBZ80_03615 [bacterium]|nr:hypothetical protein [bacterium]